MQPNKVNNNRKPQKGVLLGQTKGRHYNHKGKRCAHFKEADHCLPLK